LPEETPDILGREEEPERRRWAIIAIVALGILLLVLLITRLGTVPDVRGLPLADAQAAVLRAGFSIGNVTGLSEPMVGTVDDQHPAPGAWRFKGSGIDLELHGEVVLSDDGARIGSDEDEYVPAEPSADVDETDEELADTPLSSGPYVPEVLAMSRQAAVSALNAAGYRVSVRSGPSTTSIPAGRVFYQSLAPHSTAAKGSLVTIWVSTGPPGGSDRSPRPERP
jgi:beta-lactam-binding protein with PASTA domain